MKKPTKSGAGKSAPTFTHSPPSNLSRQEVIHALKTNAWWPFDRVPAAILPAMHRSIEKQTINQTEEALL